MKEQTLADIYGLVIGDDVFLTDDDRVPAEDRSIRYRLTGLYETPSGACTAVVTNDAGTFHVPASVVAGRSQFTV